MLRTTTAVLVLVLAAPAVSANAAEQDPATTEQATTATASAVIERAVDVEWALPPVRVAGTVAARNAVVLRHQ